MSNNPPITQLDLFSEHEREYLLQTMRRQWVDNQAHLRTGFHYHPQSRMRGMLTMTMIDECGAAEALYQRLRGTPLETDAGEELRKAVAFLEGRDV